MTLQQLQYFLSAADLGSFSAAAEAHHIAQPSVSDQIRRLEAELGVPLFVRAGRGLELTEAGRRLRTPAERALAAAGEAADSVREVRGLTGGTVTFGTFGTAHHYLLSGLVQDFRTRYPDVRVRVIGQNSFEVAEAVREGRIEAGLIVLPIDDRGLDVRPALREELHYISADPKRLEKPVTIEELARRPVILYDARWGNEDPTRRQLSARAQGASVVVEPDIEVEYLSAALDLAARGLGDTVAPRRVVAARGLGRKLGWVSLDPPLYDTFAFITRRDAHLSPATREFMAIAERRVEQLARQLREEDTAGDRATASRGAAPPSGRGGAAGSRPRRPARPR